MPANSDEPDAGNEDLKAKMREALARKRRGSEPPDNTTEPKGRQRGHAEAHGPAGGPKMHRRKAGGGGS